MKQLKITSRLTSRETNSFTQYLKNISEIGILTAEEELELTKRTERGDKDAIDELVCKNLRFVISVAKQYITSEVTLEDLVNEGNIGLIKAAKKFKPEMGNRFISYAVFWVRKIILEYLANNGKLVRLPANKLNGLSKLEKRINDLEQKLGRSVDISEVIEEYGDDLGSEDLELLDALSTYSTSSMDRDVNSDETGTTLGDLIADDSPKSATDYYINTEDIKSEVTRILDSLKPRTKRIMIALYGLDGNLPLNLKEVGEEFGITREMVRQIKMKTLELLSKKMGHLR